MAVSIRRATESDAALLAVLAEQAFRQAFTQHNSDADVNQHCEASFGSDKQKAEILDANIVVLLAESGEQLAGYAQLHVCSPKACVRGKAPAELNRMYVLDAWHGRGVAQQIMSKVLDVLANKGRDVVWLGVWEHNAKAICFYRKYGFSEVGEHAFYLGEDLQRDLIFATALSAI